MKTSSGLAVIASPDFFIIIQKLNSPLRSHTSNAHYGQWSPELTFTWRLLLPALTVYVLEIGKQRIIKQRIINYYFLLHYGI